MVVLIEIVISRCVLLVIILVRAVVTVVVEEVRSASVCIDRGGAVGTVRAVVGNDTVVQYVFDRDFHRVSQVEVALNELDWDVGEHLPDLFGLEIDKVKFQGQREYSANIDFVWP